MANTTQKKKNTGSKTKGGRGKKGGSSGGRWGIYTLLLAALCGGGYYCYNNGLPFDIQQLKWNASEQVAATTQTETDDLIDDQTEEVETVDQEEQESTEVQTAAKQEQKHQSAVQPAKKVVRQPAAKQEQKHQSAVQPTKKVVKQPAAKHEPSKFIAPSYNKYHQGRWGYTVVYPSFLTQEIVSANNDGCHFADYEGTEFISYGSWNVGEATIKELYRKKLDSNLKVTYKQLYKEEKYFIKFGYTKDGRMFYMKQVIADRLKEAPVVTGILYFRPDSKKGSEEVIKKIFDRFPY